MDSYSKQEENPLEERLKKKLANFLLDKRMDRNLTQEQVAERTGLTVEQYGRIERGRCVPLSSNVIQLLYAVGATPKDVAEFTAECYELLEREKELTLLD